MESLIRFRVLYDSLAVSEQDVFVTKFIKSFGIKLIITSVFNHFAQSVLKSNPYEDHQIQSINKIVSDIIHSRPQTQKNTNNTPTSSKPKIHIDELPPPLISNISSFLSQKKYIKFQNTNRRVYIGCNSLFSLQSAKISSIIRPDFYCSQRFRTLKIQKYKWTSSIEAHFEHFTHIIYRNIHENNFRNLKKLSLYHADQSTVEHFLFHQDQNSTDVILTNIEHLQLKRFQKLFDDECHVHPHVDISNRRYAIMQNMDAGLFLQFLSLFPNVKYLDLSHIYVELDANSTPEPIHILPKLKGLKIELSTNHFYDDDSKELFIGILNMNADCIQALQCSPQFFSDAATRLKNLQELKCYCLGESIPQITEGTNKLIMVCLGNPSADFVKKLLKSQQELKYLEISVGIGNFEKMIENITEGLCALENCTKNIFKLKFRIVGFYVYRASLPDALDKFVDGIIEIGHKLNSYNVLEFMINCEFINGVYKEIKRDLKDVFLVKQYTNSDDKKIHQFVLSKKESKMENGYNANGIYID